MHLSTFIIACLTTALLIFIYFAVHLLLPFLVVLLVIVFGKNYFAYLERHEKSKNSKLIAKAQLETFSDTQQLFRNYADYIGDNAVQKMEMDSNLAVKIASTSAEIIEQKLATDVFVHGKGLAHRATLVSNKEDHLTSSEAIIAANQVDDSRRNAAEMMRQAEEQRRIDIEKKRAELDGKRIIEIAKRNASELKKQSKVANAQRSANDYLDNLKRNY